MIGLIASGSPRISSNVKTKDGSMAWPTFLEASVLETLIRWACLQIFMNLTPESKAFLSCTGVSE
eukprot:1876492-Pyramimonas_sp.AAC.1